MRKLEQLESFRNADQVITLLSFQETMDKFLITIKNIIGASLYVHEDGQTSIAFRGKPIQGTKKRRFHTQEQLTELLVMAGLN